MGQKREVEILRLIIKDSFESRMMKFLEKKYKKKEKPSPAASTTTTTADGSGKEAGEAAIDDVDCDADGVNEGIAGNINREKVKLMREEFDLLFGVNPEAMNELKAEKQEQDGNGDKTTQQERANFEI